jgi:hypothetical protein
VGGLGAAATAASGIYTALQYRQRPEVRIEWAFDDDDKPWPADSVTEVPPGRILRVMIAARNVGNAVGEATIINFVAATCFLISHEVKGQRRVGGPSGNPMAGRHTDGRVTFLADERRFFPNMTWMHRFEIIADTGKAIPGVEYELVFVLEDQRLNSHGSHWFPSRTFPLDEHTVTVKKWRRIKSLPGEVVCGPGYRRSVRRVRVGPAVEPTAAAELVRETTRFKSVRDRVRRMRPGTPTAPVDVQAIRLRVARLLHARQP